MKGSEKQIKWAEDIKTLVLSSIDTMLAMTKDDPRANTDKAKAAQARFQRARDAVAACENAHDLIEVYKDVTCYRDNPTQAMATVAAIVANRFAVQYDTAAQQALIGE